MKNIISQVYLNADEELIQYTKKKSNTRPNFYMVGNGTMNKHKIQSINFIEKVMEMTKAEQLVIRTIMDKISYDNEDGEVYISLSKEFNATNSNVFRKGFKLLKEKDLVKRTKLSHYMINPNALLPINYSKAIQRWNMLS